MKRAGGGIIVAVVLLVACGLGLAAFYVWSTSAASVDWQSAHELVELLESDKVLSAKQCGSTVTARFSGRAWGQLNANRQRNVMLALSRVCSLKGHSNPVTLFDDRTGGILADFDGRNLVR